MSNILKVLFSSPKGIKSATLSDDDNTIWYGASNGVDTTEKVLYSSVSYVYRAIDLRAKAVSSMPLLLQKGNRNVTDSPVYQPLLKAIKKHLWRIEGAICIYGRAYLTKEFEKGVFNPYWLLPTNVVPYYQYGLKHYDYYPEIDSRYADKQVRFKPDELLVFQHPSLTSEGFWNVSPLYNAKLPAETLYNIDRFAAQYFSQGAIKATVLSVEGNPNQKHKDELRTWFRQMLSGIKRAYNVAVLSNKVEPMTIGGGLEDLKDTDITERREKHIAGSFGIPHSMLSADAANYATAESDRLNFYLTTAIPETQFILNQFNEQLLDKFGLTLETNHNTLEMFQQQELEKAQGLSTLVGKPILTIDEARETLGYAPMPKEENEQPQQDMSEEGIEQDTEGVEDAEEDNVKFYLKKFSTIYKTNIREK